MAVTKIEPDLQAEARAAANAVREKAGMEALTPIAGKKAPAPVAEIARQHSDAELATLLNALAAAAGNPKQAARRLAERGVETTGAELAVLKEQHTGLYMALADDHAKAVEDGIAQGYREIVSSAQRVTLGYVRNLEGEMDDGHFPKDIDRAVQSLAKVLQVSTDKLLAVTGRPVSGQVGLDPTDSVRELVRLGVAKLTERSPEAEAEDITDAEEVVTDERTD